MTAHTNGPRRAAGALAAAAVSATLVLTGIGAASAAPDSAGLASAGPNTAGSAESWQALLSRLPAADRPASGRVTHVAPRTARERVMWMYTGVDLRNVRTAPDPHAKLLGHYTWGQRVPVLGRVHMRRQSGHVEDWLWLRGGGFMWADGIGLRPPHRVVSRPVVRSSRRLVLADRTVVHHSRPRHRRPASIVVLPHSGSGLNWAALAQCESGGNPGAINPAGPYYGLYQFDVPTWHANGGRGIPSSASPTEQLRVAKNLYNARGRSPWPVCGKYL